MNDQERDYFENLTRERLDPFSESSIQEVDAQVEEIDERVVNLRILADDYRERWDKAAEELDRLRTELRELADAWHRKGIDTYSAAYVSDQLNDLLDVSAERYAYNLVILDGSG